MSIDYGRLYDWQKAAYHKWAEHGNCKGTIKSATGTGKTMVGLYAISECPTNVIVAVPTEALQKQWKDEIVANGISSELEIGLVGGGYKDFSKRITIGIINSLRDVALHRGLCILDEVHRYGSPENVKFLQQSHFDAVLAFSATPERQDGLHDEIFKVAPLIYELSPKSAIAQNILCEYDVINYGVELNEDERFKYDRAQTFIDTYFGTFGRDFNMLISILGQPRYMPEKTIAADLLRTFTARRQLVLNAANKVQAVQHIMTSESVNDVPKTLIFCEFIESSKAIENVLVPIFGRDVVGRYDSDVKKKDRAAVMESFKSGKCRILVSVKCLDEGVNVPDCELGILVAGSSVPRQMTQRLGRLIRNRPGKRATLYQIYVENTKDEHWMAKRSKAYKGAASSVRYM